MTEEKEKFAARFIGGIFDGGTVFLDGPWPLPDIFDSSTEPVLYGENGRYVKIRQSQLEEHQMIPYLIRGAEYKWEENGPKDNT